jgi:DNA-binding transcriptional ArsR family regulator
MEPLEFATELVDALGGVCERDDSGAASVLLTPALSARLGLREETRFLGAAAEDAAAGGVALLHGSEALERLADEAIGAGRVAAVRLDAPAPHGEALRAMVARTFRPVNGVLKQVETLPGSAEYLVVGFHYVATGEERREGIVDACADPAGTMTAPALADLLWDRGLPERSDARHGQGATIAPAAWRAVERIARARVVERLSPVRDVLAHRLERDASRLHGYYRSMQHDLALSAARRSLEPAELEKLLSRLNAIPRELEKRLAEARARLTLRVSLRPLVALRVFVPAVFVRVRVLRRKQERELVLRCAGFQRECDHLLCEGCGVPATSPLLCDDRVHLLCQACWWSCPSCGAWTCLACEKRCRRCGARPDEARDARARSGATGIAVPPSELPASPGPAAAAISPPATPPIALPGAPRIAAPVAPPGRRELLAGQPGRQPVRASAPAQTRSGGRRALADLTRQLGSLLATGGPEDQVRVGLRSLGAAGATELASHTGLDKDVVARELLRLRAAGRVEVVGRGRGTRYRLTGET